MNTIKFLIILFSVFISGRAYSAKIFLMSKNENKCVGKFVEFPSKKETAIFELKSCPSNIIWSNDKSKIFFTLEGKLYSKTTDKSKNEPQMLAKLPNVEGTLNFSENMQPQFAYLISIPEDMVKKSGEDENRKETFIFEGKEIDASETAAWGMPYMAILDKLVKDKWTRIEAKPTKSEAGETLGIHALDNLGKNGLALQTLLEKTWCVERADSECGIQNSQLNKIFNLKKDDDTYGVGSVKTKSGHYFVFRTAFGDSLHAIEPVYFCKKAYSSCKKLKLKQSDQLAILARENFVLIANEYSNDNAQIYDGSSGKVIYQNPNASSVVWFE